MKVIGSRRNELTRGADNAILRRPASGTRLSGKSQRAETVLSLGSPTQPPSGSPEWL